MVVNKRKKFSKMRGSHTHGGGDKKKRRGSGNRGGKGNASTGKRADARKPSIWKDYNAYFGKHGFKFHGQKSKTPIKAINLGDLNKLVERLIKSNIIKDNAEIKLKDYGYNKVLSKGNISHKIKINAVFASNRAVEKAKHAGAEIILAVKETKNEIKAEAGEQ